MRCQTCNQTLWNVRGRTCPECGDRFTPSQHNFRTNMVEFCCARCGQQYYGTDHSGLLVPREFACVKCGEHCSMDENMVLRPAPGAHEGQIDADDIPWPRREPHGLIKSAFRMLGMALGKPTQVGRSLRGVRETGALWWLVCLALPLSIGITLSATAFWGLGRSTAGGTLRASELQDAALSALAWMAGPAVGLLGLVLAASGITWLIVHWGDRNLAFSRVFACWSFAASPVIVMAVPCMGFACGWAVVLVWAPILAGLMLAQCSQAKPVWVVSSVVVPPVLAAVAVLTPFV
ncbi:MAG: YIP1 family protein, partial [Phycisphaerae bacterium]|nr:YIP1 family protein [Phycisphaerae bacterium]